MLEIIGLLSGLFFAYAGIPSALQSLKNKRGVGVPIDLAWSILIGTILSYVYLFSKLGCNSTISINHAIGFITWLAIIYYHYFPKKVIKND